MKGNRVVGMTYLGDGGTSVGAFHEGINFAAVQKLPLVLVIEFNGWAYSTPFEKQCAAATLADKAVGYGIRGEVVDGNDAIAVYEVARAAVERARSGGGPTLLECKTYRMKGHAEHDAQAYVDAAELARWREMDPLARLAKALVESGILSGADLRAAHEEIERGLDADVAFAETSPFPDPSLAFHGVYADDAITTRARAGVFTGGL
jgi:pyruvate dehydrogenase E1 component alpha subunit/2-oxoisovalerate dehydrogenase E1 component alpha subunit